MIKENELLEIGFERLGDDENDPFFQIAFKAPIKFNTYTLSGDLDSGKFELYANDTKYSNIKDLHELINVFGTPRK